MFGVRVFFFLFLFPFVNFAATLDAAFGRELIIYVLAFRVIEWERKFY